MVSKPNTYVWYIRRHFIRISTHTASFKYMLISCLHVSKLLINTFVDCVAVRDLSGTSKFMHKQLQWNNRRPKLIKCARLSSEWITFSKEWIYWIILSCVEFHWVCKSLIKHNKRLQGYQETIEGKTGTGKEKEVQNVFINISFHFQFSLLEF